MICALCWIKNDLHTNAFATIEGYSLCEPHVAQIKEYLQHGIRPIRPIRILELIREEL